MPSGKFWPFLPDSAWANDPTPKGRFIRSLYEARIRMDNGTDIAQLINRFINTQVRNLKLFSPLEILTPSQYNSLMKHARNADNNLYPRSWVGPPATGLDPPGQLAAANLLLSASMALMTETNSLPSPMCNPPSSATAQGFIKLPVLVTLTAVSWGLGLVNAYFLWLRYHQERKRTQTARTRESLY